MNAPKNRQSDDRKSHIANFVLVTPVAVACGSCGAGRCAVSGSVAIKLLPRSAPGHPSERWPAPCLRQRSSTPLVRPLFRGGLDRPGVHAEQQDDGAEGHEPEVLEHRSVAED